MEAYPAARLLDRRQQCIVSLILQKALEKNRYGLEVKCAATYFSPLSFQSTRPLSLSLIFLPRSLTSSKTQQRQTQRNGNVIKITVKKTLTRLAWLLCEGFGFSLEGSGRVIYFRTTRFRTQLIAQSLIREML